MYREDQTGGNFVMGVLAGACIGAGLALLFAPKSGTEIRAQLGEQYRGLADRVGQQTQNLRGRLGEQLSDRTSSLGTSSSTDRQTSQSSDVERFPSSAPSV